MPLPITIYGSTTCDDTERTREHLQKLGIPFTEVNIDHDAAAEAFVHFINGGFRSTPTVIIDAGKVKTIATEPSNEEIEKLVAEAGYTLPSSG